MKKRLSVLSVVIAGFLIFSSIIPAGATGHAPPPVEEEQAIGDCNDYNPLRNPYFGDLHVHTKFSFDSAFYKNVNGPDAAYRFAKGETVYTPDENGNPTRPVHLDRPLDFMAVTDHAEGFAECRICYDKSYLQYYGPYCRQVRAESLFDFINGVGLIRGGALTQLIPGAPVDSALCTLWPDLCKRVGNEVWQDIQDIAEKYDDDSCDCEFTTFVGYEYTGAPLGNNQHRNVIFRNENVPAHAISYEDAPRFNQLWNMLDAACNESNDCEALTIPHNSNAGSGTMYQMTAIAGLYPVPYTPALAAKRQRLEPLMEIFQIKGQSECTPGKGPLASVDELCECELLAPNVCTGSKDDDPDCVPLCSDQIIPFGGGFSGACYEPSDFARGALRNGLAVQARIGVNPHKMGFIAGTDNHNGTGGYVSENRNMGGHGISDATPESRIAKGDKENGPLDMVFGNSLARSTYNPGGLAVIWAEQNSREALFDAMQRKETYGTSGPRMIVRFFGGWNYPYDMCFDVDFAQTGYDMGVPMGGDLQAKPSGAVAPRFFVSALMDAGTEAEPGSLLQKIQIIKGWEDSGETFEKVFDVAGDLNSDAGVDIETCEQTGLDGHESLCVVWEDPEFDETQAAFYYARVVENPRCRWSRYDCNAVFQREGLSCDTLPEDSKWRGCCDGSIADTVREMAWTSPIWYTP